MKFNKKNKIFLYLYEILEGIKKAKEKIKFIFLVKLAKTRIIVGSSGIKYNGWINSDIDFLNLVKKDDWEKYFSQRKIEAILAEHVWEHLTQSEAVCAASVCYKYLKKGGYLRIAVPDGFHPSSEYIDKVRPMGTGAGCDDHKMLYTYKTLSELLKSAGFKVVLLEYFDEYGSFHFKEWTYESGPISRSSRFDARNKDNQLTYTSLILDAVK